MLNTEQILKNLFTAFFGQEVDEIKMLPKSGSNRIYYRLSNENNSAIGAFNTDIKENEAFFSFTETFAKNGINVPQIFKIDQNPQHYLIEDLGSDTLFDFLKRPQTENKKSSLCYVKHALNGLAKMQVEGGIHIDFAKAYPREAFDKQSIIWDLNYFKYNFLKLVAIPFDEQALEDDFQTLANFLLEAPSEYFMYRDFQSRNIMIKDDEPWFIDYQGGRKGPLQYDLASMLYSPKTGLNDIQRESLIEFYLAELSNFIQVNEAAFKTQFYGFALIRILQALGAYGFRGLFEGKSNFKTSIPLAICNLVQLKNNKRLLPNLHEINRIISALEKSEWAKPYVLPENKLTIKITSFSYKRGIPTDPTENGGGFVFDCRGLPNPGRLEEYSAFSGLDANVQSYLQQFDEIHQFQNLVRSMLEISIQEYLTRGFNHLCVNFGCTGGQHRSVYNALKFSEWVENNFDVNVVMVHREKNYWPGNE